MKKTKLFALKGAFVAALVATGTNNAYAVCDGCVTAAVAVAAEAIVTSVGAVATSVNGTTSAVTTGFGSLFKIIEGQILPSIKGSANAIMQMQKETAGTQAEMTLRAAYMPMIADAERRYRISNPCQVVATGIGMSQTLREASVGGSTGSLGGRSGGATTRNTGGGVSSNMNQALDIAERRIAAPAPEVVATLAAAGACSSFVGPSGARAIACDNAGFKPSNSAGYEDADIKAVTLFDGPQKAGESRRRLSIDPDEGSPEYRALQAFRRNVGVPLELRSLKPAEQSSEAGRRYLAVKDSFESRMSFADYPMQRHMGMLRSNTANIKVIEQLMKPEGDPVFVGKYLADNKPNWQSKGISADELMNLEVERRYMNLDWLKQTHVGTPEWKAGEQLRVSALQNVLLLRLRQEARINGMLLGGMLASQVRSESLPELKAAHSSALR